MSAQHEPVPGMNGRLDRYTFLRNRLRNYQILSTVLLGLVALAVGAEIYLRATTRIRLHVVEVDHLGNVRATGPAREIDTADPRLLRAQLVEWIRLSRTVTVDPRLQDLYVRSATARTRGRARASLNELLEQRNPFRTARQTLIELRDITALPIPQTRNWEIQWTERRRNARSGALQREERWRAIVSCAWQPPEADEEETNPLGFAVTEVSWILLNTTDTATRGDLQ